MKTSAVRSSSLHTQPLQAPDPANDEGAGPAAVVELHQEHVTKGNVRTPLGLRLFDLSVAVLLASLLAPLIVLRGLLALVASRKVFDAHPRIGAGGQTFILLRFAGHFRGRGLAQLINVLRGHIGFVGARARPAGPGLGAAANLTLRPGLISPFTVQSRMGLAYEDESDVDARVCENLGVGGSVTALVKSAIVNSLVSEGVVRRHEFFEVLGVRVANWTQTSALDFISAQVVAKKPTLVTFVNPHCLNVAQRDKAYRDAVSSSAMVLPDGVGIKLACAMLKVEMQENVNGTDLFAPLCERAARDGLKLFLLGAKPGVAEAVAERMCEKVEGLRIAGCCDGYFDEDDTDAVIEEINRSGADILLVAFGVPAQELWLARHHGELEVPVRVAVGGLFDFFSGRIPRSPRWMREVGMEWAWRLLQEPGRMWRRYILGNPLFVFRVWRQARAQAKDLDVELIERFSNIQLAGSRSRVRYYFKRFLWNLVVGGTMAAKRAIDMLGSALITLILSPLLIGIAVLIRIDSPGPVFFSQTRVGRYGVLFNMWKFRSMYIDAEERKRALVENNEMDGGVLFKMKHDPRITRVGRFIRKASIDELPQLWNVFAGHMSLVGPRPALPTEVDEYSVEDRRRLEVTPGITCIWQVSGRSDIPFKQQVQLDVDYIESQSLFKDFEILLKTIPAVLLGRGAY